MANTIRLRRSAVQDAVPTTAQLALGELAINTFDGKLYLKKNNGTESVIQVGGGGGSGDVTGPTSSTDNAVVRFDSTTGKLVQNSSVTIDDSGNLTITGKTIPNIQTVSSEGTITPNANTDTQVSVTALAVPATIAIPSGTPSDGQRLLIRFEDNGTGRALTWTTSAGGYRAVGLTLPTTTTATKVLYVGCIYNALDGFWDVIAKGEQA